MARIKRGIVSRKKHKKVLKLAKGYRGTKSKLIKVAREAVLHAGQYAYVGRKQRKREKRKFWIARIGRAVSLLGISYSRFTHKLKTAKIGLDRKILADLVLSDPKTFRVILDKVKNL